MQTTRDRTWCDHMRTGRKIEEFEIDGYRMVLLHVTEQSSFMQYHYRLIVFPKRRKEPVLSLNLESNPVAGTCCLGAHIGDGHENLGFVEASMSQNDFETWALDNAKRYLGIKGEPPTAQGGIRMVDAEPSQEGLRTLAEDSFELAHALVAFRKKMNKKAGGFLGMFRKIDYNEIDQTARDLKAKFDSLQERIAGTAGARDQSDFASGLQAYAAALCEAADLLAQKTDIMLQLSKNPKSVDWSQFKRVTDDEQEALGQCQGTGDRLTQMYHAM